MYDDILWYVNSIYMYMYVMLMVVCMLIVCTCKCMGVCMYVNVCIVCVSSIWMVCVADEIWV